MVRHLTCTDDCKADTSIASGTYDKASNTGGSNGATMRYAIEANDGANAGLEHARNFLEPVRKEHPWISYGDLWCLAGVEAVKAMGGPDIPIKFGRLDHTDDSNVPPNGRLPDGAKGTNHLRDIFYRMGFNDQEIVALSGAHNLGRCHGDRSGFEGPWVRLDTSRWLARLTKAGSLPDEVLQHLLQTIAT